MILVHLLIGIIFGQIFGHYSFFIIGSILPDIDHLYLIVKNRSFGIKKIVRSIKFEKEFKLNYKTPLFHSLIAMIFFSFIVYIFNNLGAIFFGIAYMSHLLIDWVDIDIKYYLWPFRIKFKGFLPIWSKFEQVLTIVLLIIILVLFI